MTFENHIWLTLTPLIVLFVTGLFVFGLRRREALLSRFAAARLLDQLTEQASQQRTVLKALLIILAFALIGISLARPQYGVDWIERKARGLDIVFVLDSSKSMLATDLRPTRLERAKLAIIDLVKRLESDRIGLVVFAGNAFLQTPPTLDYAAFRENLDSIGHTSLSRGGSDIGRAIREAAKAFPKDNNFKVVVLLTDGEDQEAQAIDTAREVAKDGIKIYTIGIGTPEGEYLKIRNAQGDEEFIRDSNGQPVRSQLDETTLQTIAQLTNGSYSRLSDQSLNALYRSVLATLPREERESELQEARIERYQWTLAIACIFLVLEIFIRRRSKASIQLVLALTAATFGLPSHGEAQALPEVSSEPTETTVSTDSLEVPLPSDEAPAPDESIHDLPTDPRILYNQAHEQLTNGNYAEATRLYEEAIALSRNHSLERDALYNMAHAASQIGEAALQAQDFEAAIENWKQAEALFQSANEIDRTDNGSLEDAAAMEARRKALEDFLKQQEPPEDQENQDQQDQEQSEEDQEQEESDEQQSEDGEQGDENQDSEESGEDEQSEQNDEQSGDEQEGDQGQDSEQGENGEQQSEQEGSEGEESGEQENQESTGNPAEDMEEQAEQEAASEGNASEESGNEEGQAPQPTEGQEGEQGEAGEMMLEGMSVTEAQDLLDSLRGSERLLPFSEPTDETRTNRNSEIRDW